MDTRHTFPLWDDHDPNASLQRLYEWTVDNTRDQIDWYDRKRRPKRILSQWLLGISVLLGGIGILCPLIESACKECRIPFFDCSVSFLHLGYIVIALAGIIILFDRVYGLSTGWMRFMETQMKLEQYLKEFCLDWARAVAVKVPEEKMDEHQQELLSQLRDFTHRVAELVMNETIAWKLEFRQNLSEIDKMLERGKPRK